MIGVPQGTLRNWEQGIRRPRGPALALLRVAEKHPEAVVDALHQAAARRTARAGRAGTTAVAG
jgi:putative transcriptional regulator